MLRKIGKLSGAKIIGSLGLLKHSLTFLMLYRESIDLWLDSDKLSTFVVTCEKNSRLIFDVSLWLESILVYAMFLAVGFIVNILNIIVSYRLYKILETVKLSRLKNHFSITQIFIFILEQNPRFVGLDQRPAHLSPSFYYLLHYKDDSRWFGLQTSRPTHRVYIWCLLLSLRDVHPRGLPTTRQPTWWNTGLNGTKKLTITISITIHKTLNGLEVLNLTPLNIWILNVTLSSPLFLQLSDEIKE